MHESNSLLIFSEEQAIIENDEDSLNEALSKKNEANFMLESATTLLMMFSMINEVADHSNVMLLRSKMIKEIKLFATKLKKARYKNQAVLAACYCLCTAIDEAVLKTSWGIKSIWAEKGLLSTFYQETLGGQRFYLILDKMIEHPERNLDVLELIYTLLNLGFEGKYYDKKSMRNKISENLFKIILNYRPQFELKLFYHSESKYNKNFNWKPFASRWILLLLTCALLIMVWAKLNSETIKDANALVTKLENMAQK